MGDKKHSKRAAAQEQIKTYILLAEKSAPGSAEVLRYGRKIWRLSLKHKIKLGIVSRRICRNCHTWFFFGKNARVRFRKGRIIITCLSCKHIRRIGHA